MRLIILNQFFYPDHSATSQLMTDLGESLVERGVEVTALAGRGRYNGGETLPLREVYRGVKIERAWATSYGKHSLVGRVVDYLSFYVGATWKLLRIPRYDIVMALTTPPLIGLVALLIARLRGMRFVALMQDVYPDIGVALGSFKAHSFSTRLLDWLSSFTLRHADRIIVLGECMRERILAKIGEEKSPNIDVIHNWADGDKIKPYNDARNPFQIEHELNDSFVVLFSGNFGRVNEFSTILESARKLREHPRFKFVFIGDGAKSKEIENYVIEYELTNILLLPYQLRESLKYSLAAGHVHLVTLADGLAGLSVPSKTYGILAAGRPIVYVGDPKSDIARLVEENRCGAAIATGDSDSLLKILKRWADNKEELSQLGARARQLFESRFSRQHAVAAYLETLTKCLDASRVRVPSASTSDLQKENRS